jgi:prepilin-type N-terminal cleavage/methylation domain-containing protein
MSGRNNAAKAGFSLVELLVVIGIIAILIALLIPSLSRAREQANRTRCQNNIRQIGQNLAVYVSDYGDFPVLDATGVITAPTNPVSDKVPVFVAARRSGLLALRTQVEFRMSKLACPEGWASGGAEGYYDDPSIIRTGTAFMDYAYWPWRFAPSGQFDVKSATFKYRQEKSDKILVTDIITDLAGDSAQQKLLGNGNHGSNHAAALRLVQRTDGLGRMLGESNFIHASGMNVLFSDYRVVWYPATKLTQQTGGLCYPPVDRW